MGNLERERSDWKGLVQYNTKGIEDLRALVDEQGLLIVKQGQFIEQQGLLIQQQMLVIEDLKLEVRFYSSRVERYAHMWAGPRITITTAEVLLDWIRRPNLNVPNYPLYYKARVNDAYVVQIGMKLGYRPEEFVHIADTVINQRNYQAHSRDSVNKRARVRECLGVMNEYPHLRHNFFGFHFKVLQRYELQETMNDKEKLRNTKKMIQKVHAVAKGYSPALNAGAAPFSPSSSYSPNYVVHFASRATGFVDTE